MILPIPPEPEALKRRLTALKEMQINDASGDSSVIWAGNKLPKYLWDAWKKDLKPIGFTWQKFMQLLRYRTDVGVMWIKGLIPWEEFVKKVDALIGGPIGKDLQKYEPRIPSRDLAQWQFPPVADWEKFERLCRDLWAEIWRNPEAQRNGRTGQPQAGVDVYGTIDRGDKWGGVQCKKRDAYADSSLTERELYEIVEAAKAFKPPLSRFTVAYTGRRDARLQEAARKITENHRALGLFQVDICSWDDILEVVGNYPSVAKKHLQLGTVSSPKLDEVIRSNQAILEQQADQSVSMAEIKSAVMPSSGDMVSRVAYQAIQVTTDASAVTHEHNAELDHVKELVDKFQPKEALDYIEKLEKRIPSHIGGPLRYRLLANKAVAKAGIGQEHEAALLFIEANSNAPR